MSGHLLKKSLLSIKKLTNRPQLIMLIDN